MFSSLTFGLGTALGSMAAGFLWDGFAPDVIWFASAASAAVAFCILLATKWGSRG